MVGMKKILINDDIWQTRVAVTRDGKLQNVYFASPSQESLERAFYKGTITKVLPGIQTAFVDIGLEKAGFLHISEIDRELAISRMNEHGQLDEDEKAPRRRSFQQTDISKILKEGDNILIQVSKEPVYEKGAKLSTCFMLPGRFIVLMPNIPRLGISKKIGSSEERQALRTLIKSNLPEGMGAIIRTTAEGRDERAIQKDITYLVNEWNTIQEKFKECKPGERIYEDIALPLQIIRDHLDDDVESIITDSKDNHKSILHFIKTIAPEHSQTVKTYQGGANMFEFYNIEEQIEQALDRKVHLKSGGSLIIEAAEAMTVVDVNTGKFIGKRNLEETIYTTNVEAAEETVRQLRLRNIGGLIVIDFIDMAIVANRRKLFQLFERTLRERDKFQSVVLKLSEFGLVQMTRKRSGKTLIQQLTNSCPQCTGLGFVKSIQTKGYRILRNILQEIKSHKLKGDINLSLNPEIFKYITSIQYDAILSIERICGVKLIILSTQKDLEHGYLLEQHQ